jgi:hypothetical protein
MSRVGCRRGHFIGGGAFRRHRVGFEPERTCGRKRIYLGLLPPRSFIPAAMDLAMMRAT